METTRLIAEFIAAARYEDMPEAVGKVAKQAFLDCVGCALAGSVSEPGRIIIELVRENGGQPKAAVIGGGFRTSALLAALANGTSAHALDYDDSHSSVHGHPTVFLMPVVLALGEELGISGKEALAAYVTGVEIAAKTERRYDVFRRSSREGEGGQGYRGSRGEPGRGGTRYRPRH